MGSHPINLAIRFLLELAALIAAGFWGWNQSDSWLRFALAIGIPIALAAMWGIFAVPKDPSRSGKAPIAVPGIVRLTIELVVFTFATFALYDLGYSRIYWVLGIVVILHYFVSYDRIIWLIKQ